MRSENNDPKPVAAAAVAWAEVAAIGNPTAVVDVVPEAAAENTITTANRSCWVRLRTGTVGVVPVITPFKYIACHIIQTISISHIYA